MTETETVEEKDASRPNGSRRALWIALGIAFAPAAISAVIVTGIVSHAVLTDRDVTPAAAEPYGALDYMIADAAIEQSYIDQQTVQMPTIGTERVTIPNHTSLPGLIVMTGDDLCHAVGGIVLQSSPPQCSVDLPNVLGSSR